MAAWREARRATLVEAVQTPILQVILRMPEVVVAPMAGVAGSAGTRGTPI